MQKSKITIVSLGIFLVFGSAGAGLAQGAPSTAPTPAARAVTPACAAATQQVTFAQQRVAEATVTRTEFSNKVAAQKAARQTAINAGDVDKVGKLNVQLGSSTAFYNTMDSAVTVAQAQVVKNQAARNAAC